MHNHEKKHIRLVYLRRVEVVVVDSLSPFVLAPANNIELDIIHIRLLVVDSTDRERLSITKEELHKMLQSDELCKASVLVFANKQVHTTTLKRTIQYYKLETFLTL